MKKTYFCILMIFLALNSTFAFEGGGAGNLEEGWIIAYPLLVFVVAPILTVVLSKITEKRSRA